MKYRLMLIKLNSIQRLSLLKAIQIDEMKLRVMPFQIGVRRPLTLKWSATRFTGWT